MSTLDNTIGLIVKEPFCAFGKEYFGGQPFDVADVKTYKWPKGTLQRRVNNGFIGYADEDLEGADTPSEDGEGEEDLSTVKIPGAPTSRSFKLPGEDEDGK